MEESGYAQTFYHSEQVVYLSLEKKATMRWILMRLQRLLGDIQLRQIHYFVLDMHSTNYMCDKCQKATEYMQNPQGDFLKNLQTEAIRHFQLNSSIVVPLQMLTRVSADISFQINPVRELRHEEPETIDRVNAKVIFAMDSRVLKLHEQYQAPRTRSEWFQNTLQHHSVFTSGGKGSSEKSNAIYEKTVKPIKIEAARTILNFWRRYKQKHRVKESENNQTKSGLNNSNSSFE